MPQCFYETLGVEQSADGATLKRAYRKLAMQYHP
jgi:molecular chaperone DnaJ